MLRIIFICLLLFSIGIDGLRRRCLNTGVLFPDKISRSAIVVYGESLAKRIYAETETELLFNITFRVDCILKGEEIDHRIEITEAGIQNNRTACQWLDPGKLYVVFLEKCALNGSAYCPMDFQERLVDDMTSELLEKTCRLTRLPPLNSISDNCPNVSMSEFCSSDETEIKIRPKSKSFEQENPAIRTSLNNVHQVQLPSNLTIPNDKSFVNHIADNPHSRAGPSAFASVAILVLALLRAMFI